VPIERTPRNPVPVGFVPKGGKRYRVQDGDSWVTVAAKARLDVWKLIEFNFRTRKPTEVNWYLRRNVGCRKTTRDGKNYVFTTSANPGVIYIPPAAPRIHYTVPGVFNIIAQPSNMTCWATVGAMTMSWRDSVSYPIGEAMDQCGTKWATVFANNRGLAAADHAAFAKAAGLSWEQLGCFPAETWERMMRDYGPLAVVTSNPYHARILVGISGDGTAAATIVDIIDPNGGRRYKLNYGRFSQDFEGVSQSPRFQIWHY
jgi:hypothetical protein